MSEKIDGTVLVHKQMDELYERVHAQKERATAEAKNARRTYSEYEDYYEGKTTAFNWVLQEIKIIMTEKGSNQHGNDQECADVREKDIQDREG